MDNLKFMYTKTAFNVNDMHYFSSFLKSYVFNLMSMQLPIEEAVSDKLIIIAIMNVLQCLKHHSLSIITE